MALSNAPRLARLLAPRPVAIVLGLTLIALGPAALLARMERDEAVANASVEAKTDALFDRHLSPSEPALIVYSGAPHILAYAARPRLILYVLPDYTLEEYRRLLRAFPARWILAPLDSPAVAALGAGSTEPVGSIDAAGVEWGLYALPD
jgi:hypothetical protein